MRERRRDGLDNEGAGGGEWRGDAGGRREVGEGDRAHRHFITRSYVVNLEIIQNITRVGGVALQVAGVEVKVKLKLKLKCLTSNVTSA